MNNSISTINVPFHGDSLYLVNYEGQPFVAMRPFIEGMGLDWASQYTKIKQRFKTCVVNITMQLPCDNQRRSVVCLALKKLTGWLHTININKVKPEIREKVAAYQDRSDDVLYEYWTTGEVKPKKSTTTDDRAPLRNAVDCLMTKRRLSFPKAYGYVHAKYGVNSIDEVPLDLLPEAVDYIYKVALEGEYIPKQDSLPAPSFNRQLSIKTLEGAMTHIRTVREYWNSGLQESLKQLGYPHTGSLTEHMIEPLFKIEWVIREIKGNDITKLPA
ncbi:phage antirepressor N-terminal domain-containing protein [Providencia sp. PROV021]|uniref:phage antirepressor N-terminal domain-containing protein n=1 Tax=Providencia sp. PROV021 TaxID=2949756 RepID=UPI002349B2BF|nr:phage antirepressor N-terminal domain-containing protein [Providencia sp. PROV021]